MAEFKKRTDIIILEHDYKVQHIHWMLDDTGEFPGIRPHIVEKIKNQEQQFKIITTVREPVARNISAFFQQVAKYCQQNNMDYTKATAEELHELFLKVYDIHWPDEWFKREIPGKQLITRCRYCQNIIWHSRRVLVKCDAENQATDRHRWNASLE